MYGGVEDLTSKAQTIVEPTTCLNFEQVDIFT